MIDETFPWSTRRKPYHRSFRIRHLKLPTAPPNEYIAIDFSSDLQESIITSETIQGRGQLTKEHKLEVMVAHSFKQKPTPTTHD